MDIGTAHIVYGGNNLNRMHMAHKYDALWLQAPIQAHAPTSEQVIQTESGHRIELPLHPYVEGLSYIGTVVNETWHTPLHYHTHFELCYVDQGQGWFTINQSWYPVQCGDLFLTKPGEAHGSGAMGTAPFRLYYLGFRLTHLRDIELDYHRIRMARVQRDTSGRVRQLYETLFDEIQAPRRYPIRMVQGVLLQLLVTVLRTYQDETSADGIRASGLSPAIQQVIRSLHASVGHHHNVASLAAQVHLSRSHLIREFKRQMGTSPGQYMRELCLDLAQHYLRDTDKSVSWIAEELRFSSIHTFSAFFKRHTGISPQAYRHIYGTARQR